MERLRVLRTARNKTQKEMACYLGIDRTTYVKYETGGSEPSNDTILKLASFFGCTTDYLLGRTDEPEYELRTELPEALKKVGIQAVEMLADANLTPEEIKFLIEFARDWKAKKSSQN